VPLLEIKTHKNVTYAEVDKNLQSLITKN